MRKINVQIFGFWLFISCLLVSTTGFSQVEKPGPSNTGYSGTLTSSSVKNITVDGTVVENVTTGLLRVYANNVTIRNCHIVTSSYYGIQCTYGATGLVIEDCEIEGMSSAAIYGSNFTARRLNIHDSGGDGIKPVSNCLVESCWIHHLGTNDGAHADGVQSRHGGTNMTFRYNNFDMPITDPAPYKSNSAFILEPDGGQLTNVLIEYNWMNGGNWTIYGSGMSGIIVQNNQFGRDYNYGILNGVVNHECNVWEDTGEAIDECTGGTPTVATPVINPSSGTFADPVTVSMTCATSGADIRYTTNGSDPTESSTLYSGSFVLSSTTIVKARGYKTDMNASSITTSTITISAPVAVTGVSVSPTSLALTVGQCSDLAETVLPANATNKSVTWSSSNASVVTVNASGLVCAVSAGNAVITVTTVDGGYTATCSVSVTQSSFLIEEYFTSGASNFSEIAGGAWSVSGGRYVLSGTGDASVGLLGNISVHNTSIANDFALSTLINITGTTSAWDDAAVVFDYQDANNYCYVSLNESNDGNTKGIFKVVNGVSTELADITASISSDTDYTLEISKIGTSIVVKLDDSQIASATDGTFTGGKVGYGSKNDAAQFDNLEVSVSGTVTVPVTGVSVSPTSLSLTEGQTSNLTETVSPVDATDKSVSWSSSNSSIATVDANGLVTAVAAGNATITVTTVDGGFTANCSVSVTPAIIYVTGVSVSPTTLDLVESETAQLTETVSPANATDNSVSWSSSNSSIATVNASGLVTAVAEGNATITVTTTDGSFTANCAVTVSAPAETWVQLTYDDFESGWGNFKDGGGDCNLYTGGTYAHQGSNAGEIQDNQGNYSTFYYTNSVDVQAYSQIKIEFWFYGLGMDDGHDFFVEYSDDGGSTWQSVAQYVQGSGADFVNGQFYSVTDGGDFDGVIIDANSYNFTSNAKIRFRCDGLQNDDQVYIDEVKVTALASGGSSANVSLANNTSNTNLNIYPNPLNSGTLNIVVNGYNNVNVVIYDLTGRSVFTQQYFNQTEIQIPANELNSGIYIISVNGSQQKLIVE